MHERFPDLTFDCTVKVEHVLAHPDIVAGVRRRGLPVRRLGLRERRRRHAGPPRQGPYRRRRGRPRSDCSARDGIEVRPSWLPFTPWTTRRQLQALLSTSSPGHDLVGNVDPVQYTIRLLLPPGRCSSTIPTSSRTSASTTPIGPSHTWRSADPAMDELQRELSAVVEARLAAGDVHRRRSTSRSATVVGWTRSPSMPTGPRRVPRLSEPWFCCAEPTAAQLAPLTAR